MPEARNFERYEIRAATSAHHSSLCQLAQYLDSVNLPNDPAALEALLSTSEKSFRGEIQNPKRREYIFVLWDRELDRAVGTSMVIGQLGNRNAPYIYFDVRREEKYSATLDRHFIHTVLTTRYVYDGPTEIGGLVVHPEYRRKPERLGTLISYVRFLFLAMRRSEMRDDILAELLPPLEADGTSHLWEAVGRRFTGLTYREADRLSKGNKEFIKGLFPHEIYATLLSTEAQRVIGEVGTDTQGVEKLLRRVGFRYAERVDPFDGGPHFIAKADDITLVRASREAELSARDPVPAGALSLAATQSTSPPYFAAVVGVSGDGPQVHVSADGATRLGAADKATVWSLKLGL